MLYVIGVASATATWMRTLSGTRSLAAALATAARFGLMRRRVRPVAPIAALASSVYAVLAGPSVMMPTISLSSQSFALSVTPVVESYPVVNVMTTRLARRRPRFPGWTRADCETTVAVVRAMRDRVQV